MKINPNLLNNIKFETIYSGNKKIPNRNSSTTLTLNNKLTDYKVILIHICANPTTDSGKWEIMIPNSNGCSVIFNAFYYDASYILIVSCLYDGDKTLTIGSRRNDFEGSAELTKVIGINF